MDTSYIEAFLRQMGKYLYTAYLYSWGEPLLHPEAGKIVHMFHSRKILTVISTNLNIKNNGLLEDICDAGLDYLDLSIDGATQEVYSQYRVGGDLDLVLKNIRHVVEYKRKLGLRTPVVEWQFLIFDHNRHEVEAAREMAEEVGVDRFKATPGIIPEKFGEAWGGYRECPFLWNSVALQVDGGISPCCNLIDKSDDFGDLGAHPFADTWQGRRYELARSLFSPKWVDELPSDLEHPCLGCSLVRIQPHLADFLKHNIHVHCADTTGTHMDDTIAVRSEGKGSDREGTD
jgi:hypothetical protein